MRRLGFCDSFRHASTSRALGTSFSGTARTLVEVQAHRTYWPLEPVPEMDYGFDYTRPCVAHFRRFDLRVKQLMDMGIEADIILMHPYDRWGMNEMSAAAYQQAQQAAGAAGGAADAGAQQQAAQEEPKKADDNVVDAEYTEVKDK